jgi:hypothetical protein
MTDMNHYDALAVVEKWYRENMKGGAKFILLICLDENEFPTFVTADPFPSAGLSPEAQNRINHIIDDVARKQAAKVDAEKDKK